MSRVGTSKGQVESVFVVRWCNGSVSQDSSEHKEGVLCVSGLKLEWMMGRNVWLRHENESNGPKDSRENDEVHF